MIKAQGIRLFAVSLALLAAGLFVGPKSASAATIISLGTPVCETDINCVLLNPSGSAVSASIGNNSGVPRTLSPSLDYIPFTIAPSDSATANVTINAQIGWNGASFQIGTTIGGSQTLGPCAAPTTCLVALTTGTQYYAGFTATSSPDAASETFSMIVPTPETSSFALLGVGLLGIVGLAAIKGNNASDLA